MSAPVRASRTHSLAREGLALIGLLAAGVLLVAFLAPLQLPEVVKAFEVLGGMVTALAGVGVGGMTVRDSVTGGLTSSSADMVLEARRIAANTTSSSASTSTSEPSATQTGATS